MPLYHSDIFVPANVKLPKGSYLLRYGPHAKQAARNDRYGNVTPLLPAYIDCGNAKVIEIEVVNNRVVKIVYRQRLDDKKDICLVVVPSRCGSWFVRTVWINLRSDTHLTLNRGRYATC